MRRSTPFILAAAAFLSTAATCETDLVEDAGFQLWCGDRLCAWDLEEGEIQKVSTWHNNDYGVELVGAPVSLSSPFARTASSLRVEVVSDVERGAMVTVEIDQDGDGVIDWVLPVSPSDGFVSRVWESQPGADATGVVYLRKAGPGRAVVARIRVSRS